MIAARLALLVCFAVLTGCVGPGVGTPASAPDVAALNQQRGVLPAWAVDHRLNGLLSRLGKFAAPASGRWRVIATRSEEPAIEPLRDGRLLVTKGMIVLAQDEAQMAGVLAVGMVRSRLVDTAPPGEDLAATVKASVNSISHRRRMIFRLNGFTGSETGDPARTALSVMAAAGYDPTALVELLESTPNQSFGLTEVPSHRNLTRALPAVKREFPDARARNRAVWQEIAQAAHSY